MDRLAFARVLHVLAVVVWIGGLSIVTTALYLFYAFLVTAFSSLSPLAFLFSLGLFVLEFCSLSLALSYAFEVLDVICRTRWLTLLRSAA